MLATSPLQQQKFVVLSGKKTSLFSLFHVLPSDTEESCLMLPYPALAVSASLVSSARCFAGFVFAKVWPTALLGQDLPAELPLKAQEGGEPGGVGPHG